jgi:adenine phosphoribosyltransferase
MNTVERYGLRLEGAFATVPGFPIPGFVFPDITPLLEREPEIFRAIIDEFIARITPLSPDFLVCIDSFGYLFGAPVAYALGTRMVLARRTGKLPRRTVCAKYDMVYDTAREICLHKEVFTPGARAVVVDDFLATGGTSSAVANLLKSLDVRIQSMQFVVELPECNGRAKLEAYSVPVDALIKLRLDSAERWRLEQAAGGG